MYAWKTRDVGWELFTKNTTIKLYFFAQLSNCVGHADVTQITCKFQVTQHVQYNFTRVKSLLPNVASKTHQLEHLAFFFGDRQLHHRITGHVMIIFGSLLWFCASCSVGLE